jgi:hypothetical protein
MVVLVIWIKNIRDHICILYKFLKLKKTIGHVKELH